MEIRQCILIPTHTGPQTPALSPTAPPPDAWAESHAPRLCSRSGAATRAQAGPLRPETLESDLMSAPGSTTQKRDCGPVTTSLGLRDLISMGIRFSKSCSCTALGIHQVTEHCAWSRAQRKGPQHCCPASQTASRAPSALGSPRISRRHAGEADTTDPDVIPKGKSCVSCPILLDLLPFPPPLEQA